MDKVLQNSFKIQIENLLGFDFQFFVQELFLLRYGVHGFTPLRPQKDKGCDGIIKAQKR